MKQIKKPDTAIFFGTYKEMIYNSTPEQCKAIMTAFCQYAFDNINPTVSSDISLVWGVMKGNIDNDYRKYNERCEKNRENALKRYGKSANNDLETVTYTINGHEFELIFPPENKANIINEKAFKELFSETEDEPQKRIRYISQKRLFDDEKGDINNIIGLDDEDVKDTNYFEAKNEYFEFIMEKFKVLIETFPYKYADKNLSDVYSSLINDFENKAKNFQVKAKRNR